MTLEDIATAVADIMKSDKPLFGEEALDMVLPGDKEDIDPALVKELVNVTAAPPESLTFVFNKVTKFAHTILIGPANDMDSADFTAMCGWAFGLVQHRFIDDVKGYKKCKKCFLHEAPAPEDSSSSDSD